MIITGAGSGMTQAVALEFGAMASGEICDVRRADCIQENVAAILSNIDIAVQNEVGKGMRFY